MTTKAEWLALAERCEKATGPDRETDGDIAHAAKQFVDYLPRVPDRPWLWAEFVEPDDWECWEAPEYTASLDAITALIAKELPDYHWRIQGGRKDTGWTQMSGDPRAYIKAKASRLVAHTDGKDGEAATPALALCAAFCRAMAEKVTA
jgi:hypothetical protein